MTSKNHPSSDASKPSQPKKRLTWDIDEQKKYLKFIQENYEQFRTYDGEKKLQLFKKMAEAIGTRDHKTCRSHHQKMKLGRTLE